MHHRGDFFEAISSSMEKSKYNLGHDSAFGEATTTKDKKFQKVWVRR
jgi:hypothetical protein